MRWIWCYVHNYFQFSLFSFLRLHFSSLSLPSSFCSSCSTLWGPFLYSASTHLPLTQSCPRRIKEPTQSFCSRLLALKDSSHPRQCPPFLSRTSCVYVYLLIRLTLVSADWKFSFLVNSSLLESFLCSFAVSHTIPSAFCLTLFQDND